MPRNKKQLDIICVVGARPNFIKIAPILTALSATGRVKTRLIHTGQHYHQQMSQAFFDDLKIPRPALDLNVGSGTHGRQTGRIMEEFEKILLSDPPDLVLVVGDVNSTLAAALAAVKLGIKVAHVEAGLRSFNRAMPEEINRILTDQISDFLFITSRGAEENLLREGVDNSKIFLVGNVMIDSLRRFTAVAEERSRILSTLSLSRRSYAVLTLHRPETTDARESLKKVISIMEKVAGMIPVVYPVHPRTGQRMRDFGLEDKAARIKNLMLLPPLGYLDFLKLISSARLVLTDSGGIQEETTALRIPCLTLRPETERPITVTRGTNIIVGLDEDRIIEECRGIIGGRGKEGKIPELWDGNASSRIASILVSKLAAAALI